MSDIDIKENKILPSTDNIYEVLCARLEHLEKVQLGIVIALITLTGVVLKNDFILIKTNRELLALYLPFAALTTLSYSIFIRVATLAKNLKKIEQKDHYLLEYGVNYFSAMSFSRKITYVMFHAQTAAPFLLVPFLRQLPSLQLAADIMICLTIIIISFFTILLGKEVFFDLR